MTTRTILSSISRPLHLCITLLMLLSSCNNDKDQEKKVLVMGTAANYPPFEFKQEGETIGFDIDFAQMIAEKLGYTLKIEDMDFHSLIPALQTKRIDFAASAFTVTPERLENLDLSIEYYESVFAMLHKKEKPLKTINDLNNTKIGVQTGTTMEIFLKETAKQHPIHILAIARTATMVQELAVGRLDGALIEESQAKVFIIKYPHLSYSLFPYANKGYAIALPKGSPLKGKINAVIYDLKKAGEINKLKAKWGI